MVLPRLLIADDHKLFAQGLMSLLGDRYAILGLVTDGARVVDEVERCQPDVLLLDLSMPNRNGLEVLDDLQPQRSGLRVLVLTMHAEHPFMHEVRRRGARGFVQKDGGFEILHAAITSLLAGGTYFSSAADIACRSEGADSRPELSRLTLRQREVLLLIGEGLTSQQIAERLRVSVWTINFHRKHVRQRLGLKSDWEMHKYGLSLLSAEQMATVIDHARLACAGDLNQLCE